MKKIIGFMFVSILMMFVTPAWSAAVLHTLQCEQSEDLNDEKLEAMSAEWLKAAHTVKGGENLQLRLQFPIAAKAGDVDVVIIIIAPSFSDWGAFMDNYEGSAAAALDVKNEGGLDCRNGSLWETVLIK